MDQDIAHPNATVRIHIDWGGPRSLGAQYSTANLAALLANFPYALSSGSELLAQRLRNRGTEICLVGIAVRGLAATGLITPSFESFCWPIALIPHPVSINNRLRCRWLVRIRVFANIVRPAEKFVPRHKIQNPFPFDACEHCGSCSQLYEG